MLDIYRIQIVNDNDLKIKILQTQAQYKYQEVFNDPMKLDLIKAYEKLQNDYKDYRSIIAAFLTACAHLETEKYWAIFFFENIGSSDLNFHFISNFSHRYEEATPFFCVSVEFNERVTNDLNFKMKGMDHELLLKCRRKSLKVNRLF